MSFEARRLATVQHIIDATHWRGAIRGQCYDCRALPSTASMVVGQSVMCHVMPFSTELVYIARPVGELWFSPGAQYADPVVRGELWKMTTGAPVYVLTCPNDWELITHIFWCRRDSNLYVCTWNDSFPFSAHIYRVNRVAGTMTLVATWDDEPSYGAESIIDTAEFGNYVYTWHNAYVGFGWLRRFDPVAGTWTEVLPNEATFPPGPGQPLGYCGGVAVDPVGNVLVLSDGSKVMTSATGNLGSWAIEFDMVASYGVADQGPLLTCREDDLVYMAGLYPLAGEATVYVRTGAGAWSEETFVSNWAGACAIAEEYVGGVATRIWCAPPVYNALLPATEGVFRRDGGWAIDWTGPVFGPGENWQGVLSQGVEQYGQNMMLLIYDKGTTDTTRLYSRSPAGVWTLIDTWPDYYLHQSFVRTCGMCQVPPADTAYTHEVG